MAAFARAGPPVLAVWGGNNPALGPDGARAFGADDVADAEIQPAGARRASSRRSA